MGDSIENYTLAAYAPPQAVYFPAGPYGQPVIGIEYAFMIKDKLKAIFQQNPVKDSKGRSIYGFSWWPDKKAWYLSEEIYNKYRNEISDYLASDIRNIANPIAAPGQNYQQQPPRQAPQPPPQNQPVAQPAPKTEKIQWTLAKTLQPIETIEKDSPVVFRPEDSQNYHALIVKDKIGNETKILAVNLKSFLEPIMSNNQRIVSESTDDLFQKYDDLIGQAGQDKKEEPKKEHKPNPYQEAIIDTFATSNKNIMISALAGTGKTTTLRRLANMAKPGEKWLYLVFNKKNQVEAKNGKGPKGEGKFPATITVATSHSFLGQLLSVNSEKGAIEKTDLWTDSGERMGKMLDDKMENDNAFPNQFKYAAKMVIKKLVSLAKAYAINPNDTTAGDQIAEIIKKYQIDTDLSTAKNSAQPDQFTPQLIDKTLDILFYSLPGNTKNTPFEGLRDHDDTLWYSAINKDIKWPHYDVVLADEVQDFNKCQSIMLTKLAEAGAKIIAVGDENQAIYLFRGADAKAFQNVQKIVENTGAGAAIHGLPINFRSGRKIIEYVNKNTHVNNLIANADFDGQVVEGKSYDNTMLDLEKEWRENGNKFKDQTAFLARTNKALVDSALELLRNNINFQIIGRDFSKELVDLVEKVTGKGRFANHMSIDPNVANNFLTKLSQIIGDLDNKWQGKVSKASELQELKDRQESLGHIVSFLMSTNFEDKNLNMKVTSTDQFIEYLKQKFKGIDTDTVAGAQELESKDKNSFVTLTSAHRSKGLEFGRVFILDRDNFPHPRAKTPEEIGQEHNAWYVALTRAKRELHVLVPKPKLKV